MQYKPLVKKKRVTRGQIVKKLDSIFSQYIRLKDATYVMGELCATCVTCGDIKPWKQQQNGHYESRGNFATRWDEDNCHVQCARCNIFLKGNYPAYARYMIRRYGADKLELVAYKAKSTGKIATVELEILIDHYKKEVALLLTKA